MAGVITETTATMHQVTLSEQGRKSRLGHTIVAEVTVNGTEALIDTSSPATIISTNFAMKVLAKERDRYQSREAAILKRFSNPEVTLRDYGGQLLNILSQVPVILSRGEYQVDVTILVQKGAPNNLLLGTDVQSQLEFSLVMKTSEAQAVDLLNGRECSLPKEAPELSQKELDPARVKKTESETLETGDDMATGVVRLLTPIKVPSGYKVLRAKIEGAVDGELLLFTPGVEVLDAELAIPDSDVDLNHERCLP